MEKELEVKSTGEEESESIIRMEEEIKNPAAIEKLNLNRCSSPQIRGLTDEYVNLQSLSMQGVGLISLEGFPKLPNLTRLNLSENNISGDLHHLHGCPKLEDLELHSNEIADVETLRQLIPFENLDRLTLDGNPVVENMENYREEVFGMLNHLNYLDNEFYDDENDEAEDSEEEDE